ncbi:MAG: prepilin-type N-terminal cleavage/methylation domain-containing protein [Gemmatimonadales bacterium]|jgi:prepilin-type N-terminal cleavage/methylation domain-containing protein
MSRRGFTLIEVMVVLVLMALLAAITTKVVNAKAASALAVMKSDLRNVASAQEAYFSLHQTYTDEPTELNFEGSPSTALSLRANDTGWSAAVEHTLRENFRCAMFHGRNVTPFEPAVYEGIMECEPHISGGGCWGG